MANKPIDASKGGADSAFLEFDSAKTNMMDARDVAPASTRQKLWRVVRSGLAIAFLWLLLWVGVMETVRVMKPPPPCPSNFLKEAFDGLRGDMSEVEARDIVAQHNPYVKYGVGYIINTGEGVFGPDVVVDWIDDRGGTIEPDGSRILGHSGHLEKVLRWEWWSGYHFMSDGKWIVDSKWVVELTLVFEDGKLAVATYSPRLVSQQNDEHLFRAGETSK